MTTSKSFMMIAVGVALALFGCGDQKAIECRTDCDERVGRCVVDRDEWRELLLASERKLKAFKENCTVVDMDMARAYVSEFGENARAVGSNCDESNPDGEREWAGGCVPLHCTFFTPTTPVAATCDEEGCVLR